MNQSTQLEKDLQWSLITNKRWSFEKSRSVRQEKVSHSARPLRLSNTLWPFDEDPSLPGFPLFIFNVITYWMWLSLSLLQGFPPPSPNLFRVSRSPTSSPTLLPSCLSPSTVTSHLLSAAPTAAVWTPARPWKLGPVCWRALHCGIWLTAPGRWESEPTCLRDLRGTSQARVTQVDTVRSLNVFNLQGNSNVFLVCFGAKRTKHHFYLRRRFRSDEGTPERDQESETETGGLHPNQRPPPTAAGGETGPHRHWER